jgi:hypothetical protein
MKKHQIEFKQLRIHVSATRLSSSINEGVHSIIRESNPNPSAQELFPAVSKVRTTLMQSSLANINAAESVETEDSDEGVLDQTIKSRKRAYSMPENLRSIKGQRVFK